VVKDDGTLSLYDLAIDKKKMKKMVQGELTENLANTISTFFHNIDAPISKKMREAIQSNSKSLVSQFCAQGNAVQDYYYRHRPRKSRGDAANNQ
jgi:hypothetical protein